MKRLFAYIILMCLPLALSAQTATEVTQLFLQKIEKKTLYADFTLSSIIGAQTTPTGSGKIRMRGQKFALEMMDTEAAYDGKTLYVYQEDIEELTLSSPEEEELLSVNPVLFAKALLKQATVRFSASQKDEKYWIIDFVPTNQSAGIQRFVMKLRKSDLAPVEILVREGKQTTKLSFRTSHYDDVVPSFKLQKDGAYLNDMR